MAVAQTAAILLGPVLLAPIVWAGFARRRTTFSRFHRKWHGSMTRESGVSWDIRRMAPVTIKSAITVVTTRPGCSKMKRKPRRAGNYRESSICADHCWQSLRHAEAGSGTGLEINSGTGHLRLSNGRTYSRNDATDLRFRHPTVPEHQLPPLVRNA